MVRRRATGEEGMLNFSSIWSKVEPMPNGHSHRLCAHFFLTVLEIFGPILLN